jgi:hypothetical protein
MAEEREENIALLAKANITDEALSQWEDRIGLELQVSNIFNQSASYEAIRKRLSETS